MREKRKKKGELKKTRRKRKRSTDGYVKEGREKVE